MLCCALIALLSGQPAVFLAAVRARLFTGAPLGLWHFFRTRALGLSIAVLAEVTVLGAGGTIGYVGWKQARLATEVPAGFVHRTLCSIFHEPK